MKILSVVKMPKLNGKEMGIFKCRVWTKLMIIKGKEFFNRRR